MGKLAGEKDLKAQYGDQNKKLAITLGALADGSMRESDLVDNAVDRFLDAYVGGKITTGTTPVADSVIRVYAYGSVNRGTLNSGGASGADATFVGEEELLFFLGTIIVDATSDKTYEVGPWSVLAAFRGLVGIPDTWGIVVKNETGVALNAVAANHDLRFQGIFGRSE